MDAHTIYGRITTEVADYGNDLTVYTRGSADGVTWVCQFDEGGVRWFRRQPRRYAELTVDPALIPAQLRFDLERRARRRYERETQGRLSSNL